jgi:peroxin-1
MLVLALTSCATPHNRPVEEPLDALGGYDDYLEKCFAQLRVRLQWRHVRGDIGAKGLGGILVYGKHGSGKTAVVKNVLKTLSKDKDVLACEYTYQMCHL